MKSNESKSKNEVTWSGIAFLSPRMPATYRRTIVVVIDGQERLFIEAASDRISEMKADAGHEEMTDAKLARIE